jgi:hypothetical protein
MSTLDIRDPRPPGVTRLGGYHARAGRVTSSVSGVVAEQEDHRARHFRRLPRPTLGNGATPPLEVRCGRRIRGQPGGYQTGRDSVDADADRAAVHGPAAHRAPHAVLGNLVRQQVVAPRRLAIDAVRTIAPPDRWWRY